MKNKIQLYFDYFVKYHVADYRNWHKSLTKWGGIAQAIKGEIQGIDFALLNDEEAKEKVANILSLNSKGEIKSVESFFDKYLFEQDNGLGNISQGVIWDSEDHPHKRQIKKKLDVKILIQLLTKEKEEAEKTMREILGELDRNYETAKLRFLRAIFPKSVAAIDAPNKLWRLLTSIQSKLGIDTDGTILNRHAQLMDCIDDQDSYKKQIFFWELYYMLENNLNLKKAIVYYGAPGTGKTYTAKKTAKKYIDQHRIKTGRSVDNNDYQIKTVQFHPSFSYEDFIEGIRPNSESKLSLSNGTFKAFCKEVGEAEIYLYRETNFLLIQEFKDKNYDFDLITIKELLDKVTMLDVERMRIPADVIDTLTLSEIIEPAFFIIDEINRAELSRVFGELMYSLEYRGYNGKIKTQYAYLNKNDSAESVFFWDNGDWFFIPQNVYLIGTMNNIDRSVDSFDFALRRRFMWKEIEPNFDLVRNLLTEDWKDKLAEAFENLNIKIKSEELLGKDYRIGHSYALAIRPIQHQFSTVNEAKSFLWQDFVKPLLEEYMRGLGDDRNVTLKLRDFKHSFGLS